MAIEFQQKTNRKNFFFQNIFKFQKNVDGNVGILYIPTSELAESAEEACENGGTETRN